VSEPPYKHLLEQLADEARESPYLERLRATLPVAAEKESLAAELVREMASALGKAEAKVLAALLELDVLGRRIDRRAARGEGTAADVARFNEKRKAAQKALWEYRVHREALGFRREDLSKDFPIPPAR
jgi:hypothetical protein